MKCLLTALNAKYIHSNLAVYSLQAYAAVRGYGAEIAEFTVNQRIGESWSGSIAEAGSAGLFLLYLEY